MFESDTYIYIYLFFNKKAQINKTKMVVKKKITL